MAQEKFKLEARSALSLRLEEFEEGKQQDP